MKSFTNNYLTHVQQNVSTLCTIVRILRKDNTEYLFTDNDSEVEVSSKIYKPSNSFVPTDFQISSGLAVDNLDITGIISSIDDITEDDIYREFFYDAKIWVSIVNYKAPDDGQNKILYGSLGELTLQENKYTVEFRNLTYALTRNIADVFSKTCRVELGSTKCGVDIEPSVWTASTFYCVGDNVSPSVYDGRRYVCTTKGTSNDTEGEPTWDTTIGNSTTETDGVVWQTYDSYYKEGTVNTGTKIRMEIDYADGGIGSSYGFAELYFYDAGMTRYTPSSIPASSGGYYINAGPDKLFDGTTGAWAGNAPISDVYAEFTFAAGFNLDSIQFDLTGPGYGTWIDTLRFYVSWDDGVTWYLFYSKADMNFTYWQLNNYTITINDIGLGSSLRFFPNSNLYSDMNYIQDGVVTWLTGDNAGLSMEVKYYDTTNNIIYLFQPMPYPIKFSDTYSILPGCNHLYLGSDGTTATGHCVSRYNNGLNFRGEPYVPTEDVLIGGIGQTNKEPYVD